MTATAMTFAAATGISRSTTATDSEVPQTSFALASRTIPMLGFTIVFAQFTSVDACNAVSAANVVCLSLLFHNQNLARR
jgi:hypothetical protein